ncbi:MAG: hypothetical protein AB1420_12355 [Bacillota bacterium]
MESIQEEIVKSLDGESVDLFPYLPYLLQDLWDIGTSPKTVLKLIKSYNIIKTPGSKVLDLGCGKGAVSINIAKEAEIACKEAKVLVVTHGFLMRYIKKELIHNGFVGKEFIKAKHGEIYVFQRK